MHTRASPGITYSHLRAATLKKVVGEQDNDLRFAVAFAELVREARDKVSTTDSNAPSHAAGVLGHTTKVPMAKAVTDPSTLSNKDLGTLLKKNGLPYKDLSADARRKMALNIQPTVCRPKTVASSYMVESTPGTASFFSVSCTSK